MEKLTAANERRAAKSVVEGEFGLKEPLLVLETLLGKLSIDQEEADKQQDNFDNIRMKIDEKNAAGRERDIKNLSTDNTDISSRVDERKQAEKQRKLEEDKKRQEEELLKKTEEMNQRARDRKEKASNIPTL